MIPTLLQTFELTGRGADQIDVVLGVLPLEAGTGAAATEDDPDHPIVHSRLGEILMLDHLSGYADNLLLMGQGEKGHLCL